MSWTPPSQPDWVRLINGHGPAAGGADRLVPLDPDELIATAMGATGLADFGPDTWRPNFDILVSSLDTEAGLHAIGRLVTRAELLRCLINRLQIAELVDQETISVRARPAHVLTVEKDEVLFGLLGDLLRDVLGLILELVEQL